MPSTSSNSSYYREHTRQQDGWTVLVSPPAADLPPPYTAQDNAMPAAAPIAPAGPATLPFQIPTNSNIIGAVPVTLTKTYACDVPFAVAFPEICTAMGLPSSRACIGYKWDNERVNAPVHQLSNAAAWTNCLESGLKMQKRAHVQTVVCKIRNLNLLEETAPPTASIATLVAAPKKRKSAAHSPDGRKTYNFTQEYRLLKKSLECATHKDQMCFVSNVDGHHKEVDQEHTSLWAKEITVGNATLSRPPENIMFQDYFLPAPKRRNACDNRVDSSTNPCAPTIYVTVNTSGSSHASPSPPRPPRRSPLSTITAATASANNIDIPSSLYRAQPDTDFHASASFQDVRYPMVTEVLQCINDSGLLADSGVIDFPTVIFANDLAQSQITHINQVPLLNTAFYVQVINMLEAMAELFVEESIAAMGWAQKGKGRM
ncbi:hypothetical protein B0H17DRAFT_1143275 [Mycena rosella]|uniref:Uncharacterized protein n=1 Tax=Mycena rosella TaxID=1033263 RepID=A0AAD7CVC6_MYCRO|nr:hypothetical protein B0H17DRAFT_1143275 [Mycena rosella]